MNAPEQKPTGEPGRKVRVITTWIVALLLIATVAHLVLLPPKPADEEEPVAEGEEAEVSLLVRPELTLVADTAARSPLDAERMMGHLRRVCELGPRISGTPAMKQQQEFVLAHLEPLADEVELQRFKARHPVRKNVRVPMANLIARWRPEAPSRLLLCAHYDTRPLADQDPDPAKRKTPGLMLGANDGASGVAVLMELAQLMAERFDSEATNPDVGVDFVLFDGEELVYSDRDPYFLGSRYFATEYSKRRPRKREGGGQPIAWRYDAAVLLDMVGGIGQRISYEGYSYHRHSRPLCQEVWGVADRLGVDEFVPRVGLTISDDHLALRKFGGIRAIDVLGMPYAHWHTTGDTPDKCSGHSMARVGWVMWEWMLDRGTAD